MTGDRPYRILEFREQPGQGLLIAEKANHDADWFSWVIDASKDPKEIDLYARVDGNSNPNYGIYKFEGDRLVIYLGAPLQYQGDPGKHTRPTSFDVEGKTGERYLELERETVAWGEPRKTGFSTASLPNPMGGRPFSWGIASPSACTPETRRTRPWTSPSNRERAMRCRRGRFTCAMRRGPRSPCSPRRSA